jgi:hypothetical protein
VRPSPELSLMLDTSGYLGVQYTFIGYSESSKEYQIFILGQRQIE